MATTLMRWSQAVHLLKQGKYSLGFTLHSKPGTYALILKSDSTARIQIGRWGQLDLQPGYYIYVGSAFGSGGVRARVSRHWRADKQMHWHIDYLRKYVTPVEVWVSYAEKKLEHEWAGILLEVSETTHIKYFGCSDCTCQSHLFFTTKMPECNWLGEVEKVTV